MAVAQGNETGWKWFDVDCAIYGIDSSASAFCAAAKKNFLPFLLHGTVLCWAWFKLSRSFWTLIWATWNRAGIRDKMFCSHRSYICSYPHWRSGLRCLRADLINHPGKFQIRSARTKYLQCTLGKTKTFSRSSRPLAECPAWLPNSWPGCWSRKQKKEVRFSGGIYTEVTRGKRPCSHRLKLPGDFTNIYAECLLESL